LATNHQIYLAIGGNIVPRKKIIIESLVAVKKAFPSQFKVSSLYLTEPFMQVRQPSYYNCCVGFHAGCSPRDLLSFCLSLETSLGRVRNGQRWQSRPIDIDILLFGDDVVTNPDLVIPHYDLENRDFFLEPLSELDKTLIHPCSKIPLSQLLERIPREKRTNPQKLFKPNI
jgi:2-amino-4-hydroxy-6-hydroxymethyldihydropteridine diphosphokinase